MIVSSSPSLLEVFVDACEYSEKFEAEQNETL